MTVPALVAVLALLCLGATAKPRSYNTGPRPAKSGVPTVWLVPHSHDDVGWLKVCVLAMSSFYIKTHCLTNIKKGNDGDAAIYYPPLFVGGAKRGPTLSAPSLLL